LKNFQEEEAKFVFLHKDYLGSILAITDEDGNRLEQRHYDAWGVLTHLKIGNEPVITEADKIATSQLLIDRGYTSHEHLLGVDLIHMNGRLYDPLLRRFLNADENIQDPYNTQNYNKYGYVLNNPLMYNDPSGEFFVAGFFLSWIAPIIWGAIVGAAVGAGLYIVQGLITNNWSWNGFAKSIIMGAVTGGVAGGLGQIFTASGFWGTVGNGALSGAGTGGVTSLINGDNFLEGVLKGAVIGGIVGGITYTIRYFNNSRTQELCKAEYDSYGIEDSGEALDPSMKTLRGMYHDAGWDEMNTGAKQFYVDHVSNGYTKSGNLYLNTKGEEVIAYTRRNFWDGNTSSISFSKHAFGSKIKLGFVMMHELGHSTLNLNAGLNNFLQVKTKSGFEPEMLPKAYGLDKISIEHGAIWGIEREFLKLNGYKELSGFFNLQNAAYFNTYFLKNQQYQHVFDAIKHLPVKFK
jgi:RHS repeat-associated protein